MNSSRRLRVFPSRAKGSFTYNFGRWKWFLSPEQRARMISTHHKRFRFPRLRVPVCDTACIMCKSHLAIYLSSCGNSGLEKRHKIADKLAIAIAMSSKSSLVFDPEVTYLLRESMTLWQANLLAYKWGKISLFVILDNFCCIFFSIRLSYPISFLPFLSSFCSVKVYLPLES